MKKLVCFMVPLCLALIMAMPANATAATDAQVEALLAEVRALRDQVTAMESKLTEAQACALRAEAASKKANEMARKLHGRSLKLSRQFETVQTQSKTGGFASDLGKRLSVYGAIELEGSFQRKKPKNGKEVTNSDLSVATAEIFFEATINKYTRGVLHFLWEQGDTDYVDLDEAFIIIGQTEDMPFYFLGGRIYPAIGLFETYLISDPITQNLFEVQATAGEIGWAQDWINFGAGLFNAGVSETSDNPDDLINSYYARVQVHTPEGLLGDVNLRGGIAYINNIAASGTLTDEIPDQQLSSLVGGFSAMVGLEYKWFAFTAEYLTAADEFKAGELGFTSQKATPKAWNLEVAFMPLDDWTFAMRYEGSSDMQGLEPERQWGLGASWEFLPDTVFSVEYLQGDYQNEDERNLFTTQLAVGF